MREDNKKVIRDFVSYLNSDTIRYSFNNGDWSYDSKVYDFISYCYENNIVFKYDSIEERKKLQEKDIYNMSKVELRKYLFILFSGERFSSGMIMQSIKSGKLKTSLEKLLDD